MLNIEQKKKTVDQLREKIDKAQSVVFVDFSGLGAESLNNLRRKVQVAGGDLKIAKNTLVTRALGQKDETLELNGPTALIFSVADLLEPIKALAGFRKEFERPEIKGGFFEKQLISPEKVLELAEIPNREVLISRIYGQMRAPLQRFVSSANSSLTRFRLICGQLANQRTA